MHLETQAYSEQVKRWPGTGQHILAQFTDNMVVVYQAYRPAIGRFAAEHGYFGGEFGYGRMSWIKPNFLWMMHRCGWGTKKGQEVTLAVRLKREGFDRILEAAVHSSFVPEVYESKECWMRTVKNSDVRLQWDPDHDPYGGKCERRAIQLGLRRKALGSYGRQWIVDIDDISGFVREQREHVTARQLDRLVTPRERVYPVKEAEVRRQLQLTETCAT